MRTDEAPGEIPDGIRRRSLLQDLVYSLIIVVTLISAITASGIYFYFQRQAEQEFREHLDSYMNDLGHTLELPLWNMEDELVRTICSTFTTHEDIAVFTVRGDEGQLLCNKQTGVVEPEFSATRTIVHQRQQIGSFQVGLDMAYHRRGNSQLLVYNLATTLAVLTVLALTLRAILRRFLRAPLGSLLERIESLGEGTYQAGIAPGESLEFALILNRFNDMAAQVEARESALRSINQQLSAEIAERERAEDALRQSELLFRALFEQAAVGVAQVHTGTGRFVRVNRRYCDILGYAAGELQGLTTLEITHPDDRQSSIDHMAQLVSGQILEYSIEKRCCRKDGNYVWIDLTVSPLWAPGEAPNYHMAVVQDIDERVRAQEALKRLNQELERRVLEEVAENREKDHLLIQQSRLAAMGEMVHNIAHQWRQPLNALSVIIANVKDDYAYGEMTEESLAAAVDKSHRLLAQMSNAIDEFRDFFRPDREGQDFQLAKVVADAIFIVDDALRNNQIHLDQDLDPSVTVYGFPNQFAQAVLNLLVNAKEALRERNVRDGSIRVRLRRAGDQGILTIADNAGGIPADVLPRVFDPYFTTKEQGSGIGLYMSKIIVERNMKGKLLAANGSDGAIFTITVPLSGNL